ncbi:transcriptional regulator [Thalassotalea loyana]|uniref:Transcriptional regulator n=1 Tax=Thalassotalea loyana TaxID=280483 RepID=A0ABQ6HEX7_9GAMM|nr:LysR family transcriptional regulator [Thalassotalea loyana]GLX85441.1 transcriptional regulator [Thalassotalea loyana]
MDKLTCIRVFVVVARHQSFTLASNELNTSQSAISKKIAWLEKDIGFSLFERGVRKIEISNLGRQYLNFCHRLLEQIDTTELTLRHELTSLKGKICISAPSTFSIYFLAPVISQFIENYPEVTFDVSVNDKQVSLFKDDIDIAIRAAHLPDSALKAKRLMAHQVSYFVAPKYLETCGRPESTDQLINHRCITYALAKPSNVWTFGSNEIRVNESLTSDNPEFIIEMCRRGHGIAAMPKWMVESDLAQGRLIEVLQSEERFSLPMYAVYKNTEYMPYRLKVFLDFLAQELETK